MKIDFRSVLRLPMRYTANYELDDDWLEEILESFEEWFY